VTTLKPDRAGEARTNPLRTVKDEDEEVLLENVIQAICLIDLSTSSAKRRKQLIDHHT
jgi:hypothetical protein